MRNSIKRVAKRIVATKAQGHDVVVVISAMGDTTDELMDLALQVSPLPPPRELDMLLTAGRADERGAAGHGHPRPGDARPLADRLAGRHHHHRHPRQRPDHRHHPRPDHLGPGPGRHRHRRRLPGGRPGHQGRHHPGPRRLRHHRGRPGRLARGRLLRDLHRRRRRLHRRPADRAQRPADPGDQLRGDAGDGGLRRQDPASALRGVRAARERPRARALLVLRPGRHLGAGTRGRKRDGAGDHLRRRPRPQRGQDHHRRACPTGWARRRGSSRPWPRPRSTST